MREPSAACRFGEFVLKSLSHLRTWEKRSDLTALDLVLLPVLTHTHTHTPSGTIWFPDISVLPLTWHVRCHKTSLFDEVGLRTGLVFFLFSWMLL